MRPSLARALVLAVAGALTLAGALLGCGGSPTPTGPIPIKVGLGYIPNVQFAQFYLAVQNGYYRDAGLDVTLQNGDDAQILTLLGQGALDIGLSDGTSIIPAVSRDIPVKYVATVYARFPSVVFAKTSSGIAAPGDLDGRSLGIPAKSGSSWIMLQALLASAGLTTDDLDITVYPDFGQRVAVQQEQVDSATGFVNNEPVQMQLAGEAVTVLTVDAITPLPGPGLVVGTATLGSKSAALKAFVAATLRAMQEIIANPQLGFDASFAYVPELAQAPEVGMAVLEATAQQWSSAYTDTSGLGAIDESAWTRSVEFMSGLPDTLVAKPVTFDQLATEELLP